MLQPVEKYIEHITYIVIILIFIPVQFVAKCARLKRRFTVVSELERQRLEHFESDSIRTMRQMTDLYFVDFIELTLKSKDDFSAVFDIVLI